MFERLSQSLKQKVALTDEEFEICKTFFIPKKLRKRQFLLQEGDVCNRIAFVEKGALYSYSIDNKGTQRVIQFAFEGWWIADLYSFLTREPSNLSIEVLEDCEVLLIEPKQHEELMKRVPAFNTYVRIVYQDAYVALQRRIESTIGLTAEEKYSRLISNYSSIMNRVPQHLIASYLGVTPETLSRIRKQIV